MLVDLWEGSISIVCLVAHAMIFCFLVSFFFLFYFQFSVKRTKRHSKERFSLKNCMNEVVQTSATKFRTNNFLFEFVDAVYFDLCNCFFLYRFSCFSFSQNFVSLFFRLFNVLDYQRD